MKRSLKMFHMWDNYGKKIYTMFSKVRNCTPEHQKKLENEFIRLEREKAYQRENEYDAVDFIFRGVNSALALKKRYKDLMKIFHPDNISGDQGMVQLINQEYSELCRRYDVSMIN